MSRSEIFRQRLALAPELRQGKPFQACLPLCYQADYMARFLQSWWQEPAAQLRVLDLSLDSGLRAEWLVGQGLEVHRLQPGTSLSAAEHSYHGVFSSQSLSGLGEVRRVLKPGGLFFAFSLPSRTSRETRLELPRAQLRPLEFWRRELLPRPWLLSAFPYMVERLDQWLCRHTPLAYWARYVEFVAYRD